MIKIIKTIIFVISVPLCLFLTVLAKPNLSNDDGLVYAGKQYIQINEPNNFVYYASQADLFDGKIIGRDGHSLVYKLDSDDIIFKKNIIGSNELYRKSELEILPNNFETAQVTSLSLLGESNFFEPISLKSNNHIDTINFLENASQMDSAKILFEDVCSENYDSYMVCAHCETLCGYYVLGDIMIFEDKCMFRPAGIMDKCYPITLNEIAD